MAGVAGAGAGGFLPQVPSAGAAEGPTCTYYTEQRSFGHYDLFATTFPRNRANRAPPRRMQASVDKDFKCTVLPALSSIDGLLSPSVEGEVTKCDPQVTLPARAVQQPEAEPDDDDGLSGVLPNFLPRRSLAQQEQALSRVYPGRCSSTTSDDEFRGWLTPLQSSPRDGPLTRQELMSPCRGRSDRGFPVSSSSMSMMSMVSEDGDMEEGGVWYLMLMRSTYETQQLTPQRVAFLLCDALGLPMQEAEQRARDAQVRLLSVVQQVDDRRAAFARLRTLRRAGLSVQVVTQAGAPRAGNCTARTAADDAGAHLGKSHATAAAKKGAFTARSYGEVFRRSLRGTDCNFLPRLPAAPRSGRAGPRRGRTGHWKGEGGQVAIDILPEDPVSAFFVAESDRAAEAAAARERRESTESGHFTHRPRGSTKKNALASYSSMIWRHRTTLKNNASQLGNELHWQQSLDEEDQPRAPSHGSAADRSQESPDHKGGPLGNLGACLWEAVLDAVVPQQKIPQARKEACQMMRFFVFGRIGNENARTQRESEKVLYEAIGSRDEVLDLFKMWRRIDDDNSGRVDILEFRQFAEANMREKVEALLKEPGRRGRATLRPNSTVLQPAWAQITSPEEIPEFVARLCGKLGQLLLGKKSSFVMEDMMRLIWPCAQQKDLRLMRQWCRDFLNSVDARRTKTPPLLPQADYQGLCSVFQYFDEKRSGKISLEDLVSKGLIYEDLAAAYFQQWDRDGNGHLDLLEFCEMMCPMGFRAHPDAETGSLPDGTRVVLDRKFNHWRITDKTDEVLATHDR